MKQRLVTIAAGFAGMHAALSAARLRDTKGVSPDELEIAVISPEPVLVIRPRLYEPAPETLTAPLLELFRVTNVVYVQGSVETIDTKAGSVDVVAPRDRRSVLTYEAYVTCLDLGAAGALFTRGWDRKVALVGAHAKKVRPEINTVWIYPPRADRAAALAATAPERVTHLHDQLLDALVSTDAEATS